MSGSGEETILTRRQRLASASRACEACKIRKQPRSAARSSKDRNVQLERHVATFEGRLAKLERQAAASEIAAPTQALTGSSNSPSLLILGPYESSPSISSDIYEGDTSFLSQSVLATELAGKAASSKTPEASSTISEPLSRLDALLHSSPATASTKEQEIQHKATSRLLPGFEPLPDSFVIAVIRRIKVHSAVSLSGYFMNDIMEIEKLSQRVHFPVEPVTLGQITSLNGIFYMLVKEFKMLQVNLGEEYDLDELLLKCQRNFNLGIETYEILVQPTYDNVLALTLAVVKAQNDVKPQLCSSLIAAATNHCQMLGYHRESTYRKDSSDVAEAKRRIFWTLYVFDKNTSLLLGRSAKMQDADIDVRSPVLSTDRGQRPWDEWFLLAIRLAKTQGQIYDQLYSASALQATSIERKRRIDSLIPVMHDLRRDLESLNTARAKYPALIEASRTHWDIMYYSTLTILLRAPTVPGISGEISSECFQAARLSLRCHLRCYPAFKTAVDISEADYVSWFLHSSSFTPFVVIFLHAIAANSIEDLCLLEEVIESLKSARKVHSGTEKLFQICSAFGKLARQMVTAKDTSVGTYDQEVDSLELGNVQEDMSFDWPEFDLDLANPEFDMEIASGCEDIDMAAVFNDWYGGQPGMDFLWEDAGQMGR
ncbi:hypothetical protein FSARC_14722 [Fusarium sarcochroum]|uniref:Xylanolytic transcriptional activator regulatory domain-containing protein n=1 Tax=Fusarium sarcochroum TaxID=1208366 RepID=A0A8H4WNJ6_9HYPO|nr:hypothetical protein FSARC_14722 [Fusarium sarcochroum]